MTRIPTIDDAASTVAHIERLLGSELDAELSALDEESSPVAATQPTAAPVGATSQPVNRRQAVAPLRPPSPSVMPSPGRHQIVAITSGKGGVGTSVVAANLGLLVASEARMRVVIVDLDLQQGGIRQLLCLAADKSIVDVADESPEADRQALLPRLVDGPGGVIALLAPASPGQMISLDPGFIPPLFHELRSMFDLVIVDIPSHLTEAGAAALRGADRVLVIGSMSRPGVAATTSVLSTLAWLSVPAHTVLLALNRNEANSDLTKAMVEEALGWPAALQLPYDPILVSSSINRGEAFVLEHPDAQVTRKLRDLAGLLVPMPAVSQAITPDRTRVPPADDEGDDDRTQRKGWRGLFGLTKP